MRARSLRRRDDGAVLVWAAFMLTVLLGVGAVVIDVGALYLERRELQNGADAAALAVAKDCAEGDCDGADSAQETAGDLADENANDGEAAVDLVCGEGEGIGRLGCAEPSGLGSAAGWVRVDTSTLTEDGESQVGFVLAHLIGGGEGATVTASATAAWGPAREIANAVPIAMSTCALSDEGGPPDPGDLPEGRAVVYFHDSDRDQDHAGDCSLFDPFPWWPGPWDWDDHRLGFGWLDDASDCGIDLQVGATPAGEPGSADLGEVDCVPGDLQNRVLTVPVYDRADDRDFRPTEYRISGFVGFRVTAYRLGDDPGDSWNGPDCIWLPGFGQLDCIEGEFVPLTTTVTTSGMFSTGPDYGVRTVRMVG